MVGAGASYDCYSPIFSRSCHAAYRPPLTFELFDLRFEEFVRDYPKAKVAGSNFLSAIQANASISIEQFLIGLRDSTNELIQKQFFHTVCYLQRILIASSFRFLDSGGRSASCFTRLVAEILNNENRFDRICFVTTNYDVLLEFALNDCLGARFDSLDNYLSFNRNSSLVKLHGSVDWGYSISPKVPASGGRKYSDWLVHFIDTHDDLESCLSKNVEKISYSSVLLNTAVGGLDGVRFPALAAPVADKYKYICPEDHVANLHKNLENSEISLIVIGFSAKDADVKEIMSRHMPNVYQITVVDKDGDSIQQVRTNLHSWGLDTKVKFFQSNGFTYFALKDLTNILASY